MDNIAYFDIEVGKDNCKIYELGSLDNKVNEEFIQLLQNIRLRAYEKSLQ